ncbi:MAG: NUDIX hydrolase [Bryobacteraceae bacterium]
MDRQYPDRPLVGVGAIVVDGDRLLLVQRGSPPHQGQWSLPGGLLEAGERLEDAVKREVREETGLEVEVLSLGGVFERIVRDDTGRLEYHYVLLDYLCRPCGGRLHHGSDAVAAAWVPLDQLATYPLTAGTREFLEKILKRQA